MLYGRRQGRVLKEGKKTLLETLLPLIQVTIEEGAMTCQAPLKGYREVWLEIGFGNGDHLAYLAEKYPDVLMIGCEPFVNGIGALLFKIKERNLSNIRIFKDAAQLLLEAVDPAYFSKAFLLFPDPWPKKRHHKRRFVQPLYLSMLSRTLKEGSPFLFATDHAEYRAWALEVFQDFPDFDIVSQGFDEPKEWVQTRFQQKGITEGRLGYFVQLKKNVSRET